MRTKTIINIIGPSGSGKNAIGKEMKKWGIPEGVSNTTRKMREGEIEGVSYYFNDEETFDKIDRVEYTEYANGRYCLSKDEVESKLKVNDAIHVITDIDGNKQIKEKYGDIVISIFIDVTYSEMIKRMKFRGDSKQSIADRIAKAIMDDELDNGKKCDYVLRNDSFSQAIFELKNILQIEGITIKEVA